MVRLLFTHVCSVTCFEISRMAGRLSRLQKSEVALAHLLTVLCGMHRMADRSATLMSCLSRASKYGSPTLLEMTRSSLSRFLAMEAVRILADAISGQASLRMRTRINARTWCLWGSVVRCASSLSPWRG